MQAAVVDRTNQLQIQTLKEPELPPSGGIIRVIGCGICGSDLDKLFNRSLQEGAVLGHEVVGILHELSAEAQAQFPKLAIGQRVAVAHHVPCQQCYYCLHQSPSMCKTFKQSNIFPGGFSEYIAVSEAHLAHTVFPIPDEVSNQAASCVEPLACCLRAVDRLPENIGNHVAIVGLGFIGLLTAQYLRFKNHYVYGIDLQPERIALAQKHHWLTDAFENPQTFLDSVQQKTAGRGADIVFLSVVNPKTLDLALQTVRDGGTLLLFSSYSSHEPILNQNDLYFREINIITSYSPSLEHLQKAHQMITSQQILIDPLVTETYLLSEVSQGMKAYQSGKALKVFIQL